MGVSKEEKKKRKAEYDIEYRRKNKEKIRKYQKKYRAKNRNKSIVYSKTYYKEKKEKLKKSNKIYREKNKEKAKEYSKLYRQTNNDKIKKQKKDYYQKNKKEIQKKTKEKIESCPLLKTREKVRCLIKRYFQRKGFSKKAKSTQILGCDYEFLNRHLISTFEKNYGIEWKESYRELMQVDHIIPISTAESEEEVYRLNHYTNLQFLYYRDNLIKSNREDWKLDLEKTKFFCEING